MSTVRIQKYKGERGTTYAVKYKDPLTKRSKHYKSFKRYKDANQAVNNLRALLDSGNLPEKSSIKFSPMTFNEVAKKLQLDWIARNRRGDLADKTLYEYSNRLDIVCRIFGDKLLGEISKDEITEHVNEIAGSLTNITANKTLSAIKKVFEQCLYLKAVVKDVATEIKFLSEKGYERNNFLLPHQISNLISATQGTRAKFYMPVIIYLGAEHGAAKQEILSLKWSDIDFEFKGRGLIKLYRTKNKRKRTEFLMPRTKQAFLDWKDHLEYKRRRTNVEKVKSDHVICRIDGTPIKCFNKAWWHALKVAEISDFHFHDLRHTFCSNLIMSGGDLKDAKEMIGHSDISMTDRYSHISVDHVTRRQDQLAEHYLEGLSN
jgi:integrase